MFDCIIVGLGPAGISAAIYLNRANKDVVAIGKDYGILGNGSHIIENYYGFEPISGKKLIEKGIQQAKKLNIPIHFESVVSIDYDAEKFTVETDKTVYEAKTLLLATGRSQQKLNVKNFHKYTGKGISFCSICDGFAFRNKRIAVVGYNFYLAHELKYLENITKDITIFTNGKNIEFETAYPVIFDELIEIHGNDVLTGIQTNTNFFELDGMFVAIDTPSSLEFTKTLGIISDKNSVVVDDNYMTNIEGLFAAGDIIGGKLQISKAVYDGMQSAFGIINYLRIKK